MRQDIPPRGLVSPGTLRPRAEHAADPGRQPMFRHRGAMEGWRRSELRCRHWRARSNLAHRRVGVMSAAAAKELTVFGGGVLLAYHVGACIGSLLVATGQTLSAEGLTRAYHRYGLPQAVWMQRRSFLGPHPIVSGMVCQQPLISSRPRATTQGGPLFDPASCDVLRRRQRTDDGPRPRSVRTDRTRHRERFRTTYGRRRRRRPREVRELR